jgi:nicotianamine synthase
MDLTRIECLTLEAFLPASSLAPSHRPTPQNVAFIGSGPLPLTSLCILDMYPAATVHNIDRDEAALRVSQALCGRLACGARMTFACEDVSQIQMADNADGGAGASTDGVGKDGLTRTSWEAFDVVFLAALVGLDTGAKVAILAALAAKLTSGTLIVARSAQGLRAVLYPVSFFYMFSFLLLLLLLLLLSFCLAFLSG